mgnify:FL=1
MAVGKKTEKTDLEPVDEVKVAEDKADEATAEVREAALPSGPDSTAEGEVQRGSDFTLKYDMNSNQRYVDSTSQKSEFDRVLDELASISRDMLDWDLEKFTKKHGGDTEDSFPLKLEAFLGGFIVNAAVELYNRGYSEAAFRRLEQARTVLEAKKKLEVEVEAIKAKQDGSFDLSDMLGLSEEE